jgi:YfiH family protein
VRVQSKAIAKKSVTVIRVPALSRLDWLVHGFSTRKSGFSKPYGGQSLNLGFTAHDAKESVLRNRQEFFKDLLASARERPWPLITLRQVHSDLIHCVSKIPAQTLVGDGLISDAPRLLLAVLTADCLPVILIDTKNHAVGVFHAGWRGTVKRIVEKGVGEMQRHFGTLASNLKAAMGPGIRGCCYQVGPELKETFSAQFRYADGLFRETKERDEIHEKYPLLFLTARAPGHSELPKKIFLDLAEANRQQLLSAGVPARNIYDVGMCTSCQKDLFFSHRAEKGNTGRMMAAVGIRD